MHIKLKSCERRTIFDFINFVLGKRTTALRFCSRYTCTISWLLELNIFFCMCFHEGVILSFFHSFSENSQEEKPWCYVNGEHARILFALNCCGILCLSGYLAVTIFCHPNSLYPDKAMYKTLWLTCLFVLGIWFQNIIWITGFKFHGLQFKMRWRKVLSTHRWIVLHIYIPTFFFLKGFNFTLKILLHWLPLSLKGLIILLQIHVPLCESKHIFTFTPFCQNSILNTRECFSNL